MPRDCFARARNDVWRRVLAFLFAVIPVLALAQSYPAKPVKFINGFAAGGSSDLVARLLAQNLTEAFGQQVVVETRTGSGGIIANDAVAKSAPDGHTLVLITGGYPAQAATLKTLPYDPVRDFAMISTVTFYPFVLAVSAASPYKTVADLLAYAKANRGKTSFASAGVGSLHHLSGEWFNVVAGTDLIHVPFRGGTAPVLELQAGRVDAMFETMTLVMPQIKAGKLRALAVLSKTRSEFLPEVPSLSETFPDFEVTSWLGVATTAGTPAPIIDRLNRELRRIVELPEVRQRFADLGGNARSSTPEEMLALVEREIAKWKKVVAAKNIELQ